MATNEKGSGSVLAGIVALAGLIGMSIAMVVIIGIAGQRQARHSADLASLGAAQALQQGNAPCVAAEKIAYLNRSRLGQCQISGDDVSVETVVTARWHLPGLPHEFHANAVAGPLR
ncbi:MAG: Rv3654c family TadE-like protein [Propionibacteriaceae bacterium]